MAINTLTTTDQLLADLYRLGIRIRTNKGRLQVSGPEEAFDEQISDVIKARKADILDFLSKQSHGTHTNTIEPTSPRPEPLPLSFAQQRLWFLQQIQPESAAYNLPLAIAVDGTLDEATLKRSLEAIVERHEVLRSVYDSVDGEPHQRILELSNLEIETIDLRLSDSSRQALDQGIRDAATTPFDLARDIPLRITLYRTADNAWVVLFTVHHIAADAWSLDILLKELGQLYPSMLIGGENKLPPMALQYADFSIWQRSPEQAKALESELDYWRQQLDGELPRLQLPTDFPRPRTQTFNGDVVEFKVPASVSEQLRTIGQKQSASLFMTLLAAFNILLYRYSGQRDILIGTPVANRQRAEVEPLIGLFVNTLVIRSGINPAMHFGELIDQVRETTLSAYDHQDLPFEHLVEALAPQRDPSLSPLFQVKFRLENAPEERIELPGLTLSRLPQQVTMAKLDLSVDMYETADGLVGGFEYNSDLFRKETMQRMAEQFSALLEKLAEEPSIALGSISVLTTQEQLQQQISWNNSAKPYNEDLCYHQLFEARAERNPDAIAVVFDGPQAEKITYGELNQRSNQLAHYLREQGVGPEQVVAICLERSSNIVISMLAVLKAGGAYLPLDANYPADRLQYMLEDADAQLVLSHSDIELPQVKNRINLDQSDFSAYPVANPESGVQPQNLAYLIYTSGSTGLPKGVLVAHAGLVNLTEDKIRKCDVRPDDCVLQFFSFSFDGSVPEFVMTLAIGARLLMAPAATVLPVQALCDLIQRNRVTHMTITPSALNSLPQEEYPDLRMVLVGGEAPAPELIHFWSQGRDFINAYGPTETTVNASMVHCGNGEPIEPTVLPSANKQLYVLDEDLQIAPVGAVGELHIAGVGITRGYLHRAALTAERFIPNPFANDPQQDTSGHYAASVLYKSGDLASYQADGRIRLLGRIDQQTKIRGFRIEIGEIEQALESHPQIRSGVVTVREQDGDKRLVAYGVANRDDVDSAAEIRRFLADKLPQFMVPSAFAWLPELPLTSNGKLDLNALPDPIEEREAQGQAPSSETEIMLAELFSELLSVDEIGLEDNFFDLGGHSLLATRMVAQMMERYGVDITVLDLFEAPSVGDLAQRIEHKMHLNPLLGKAEDEEDREEITL